MLFRSVAGIIFGGAAVTSVDKLIVPFIGLMVTIALVTFIVNKLSLPNIAGTTNEGGDAKNERSIWSFRHLALGVAGIFFYVGVEVCVGANIVMYAESLGSKYTEIVNFLGQPLALAAMMASLYWFGMLVGRLLGSTLSKIDARIQLLFTSVVATVLIILSMVLGNPWLLVAVGLLDRKSVV